LWNISILSFGDLSEERREITGLEGNFQSAKFINETAQRPDVTLIAIFLSRPYFRACVVWSSSLSGAETILGQF